MKLINKQLASKQKQTRVLYAFQGTGNGHSARLLALYPELSKTNLQIDYLISGNKSQLNFPFSLTKKRGIVFEYGDEGEVAWIKTMLRNNWIGFLWTVIKLDISQYDIIINDFEPVSAWKAKLKNKPIVGLSHQAAVYQPLAPKPEKISRLALFVLKYFAPTKEHIGFHFQEYDSGTLPPLATNTISVSQGQNNTNCVVYLPAFDVQNIIRTLEKFPFFQFTVFHPAISKPIFQKNVIARPIDKSEFGKAFADSGLVICSAGFELPAEALAAGKELLAIPIRGQYEQLCNAAALQQLPGATIIKELTTSALEHWLSSKPTLGKPLETISAREVVGILVSRIQKVLENAH